MQASLYNHFNALGLRYSSHYYVLRKICIIYVTASGLRKCLVRHQQTSKHELYMIMRLLISYVLLYFDFLRNVFRINLDYHIVLFLNSIWIFFCHTGNYISIITYYHEPYFLTNTIIILVLLYWIYHFTC